MTAPVDFVQQEDHALRAFADRLPWTLAELSSPDTRQRMIDAGEAVGRAVQTHQAALEGGRDRLGGRRLDMQPAAVLVTQIVDLQKVKPDLLRSVATFLRALASELCVVAGAPR